MIQPIRIRQSALALVIGMSSTLVLAGQADLSRLDRLRAEHPKLSIASSTELEKRFEDLIKGSSHSRLERDISIFMSELMSEEAQNLRPFLTNQLINLGRVDLLKASDVINRFEDAKGCEPRLFLKLSADISASTIKSLEKVFSRKEAGYLSELDTTLFDFARHAQPLRKHRDALLDYLAALGEIPKTSYLNKANSVLLHPLLDASSTDLSLDQLKELRNFLPDLKKAIQKLASASGRDYRFDFWLVEDLKELDAEFAERSESTDFAEIQKHLETYREEASAVNEEYEQCTFFCTKLKNAKKLANDKATAMSFIRERVARRVLNQMLNLIEVIELYGYTQDKEENAESCRLSQRIINKLQNPEDLNDFLSTPDGLSILDQRN